MNIIWYDEKTIFSVEMVRHQMYHTQLFVTMVRRQMYHDIWCNCTVYLHNSPIITYFMGNIIFMDASKLFFSAFINLNWPFYPKLNLENTKLLTYNKGSKFWSYVLSDQYTLLFIHLN